MVTPIRHDDSLTIPTPSLALEFMLEAGLKPPVQIGLGAFGTRIFYEVTGGRAEGPRFKAEVLTGGGDWLLAGSDGLGRRDVRIQFRTDDGAFVSRPSRRAPGRARQAAREGSSVCTDPGHVARQGWRCGQRVGSHRRA